MIVFIQSNKAATGSQRIRAQGRPLSSGWERWEKKLELGGDSVAIVKEKINSKKDHFLGSLCEAAVTNA